MNKEENDKFLVKPPGLGPFGEAAYLVILEYLVRNEVSYVGGCTAFYSPQQWKERGEEHGLASVLIVCHDGGEHANVFNPYTPIGSQLRKGLMVQLARAGLWNWYTAIYAA